MLSAVSNNQIRPNQTAFGACLAKSGRKIAPFEEVGHLIDICLQSRVEGLKYGSFCKGVYVFVPHSEQTPKVFLNESKRRITAEMPNSDVLIFHSPKTDSEEQKNLFQKTVDGLSAIITKAKHEEAIRKDKCRRAETMDYFGIVQKEHFVRKY